MPCIVGIQAQATFSFKYSLEKEPQNTFICMNHIVTFTTEMTS